ncbi:1,4-alpha-glucan-branching enzyme [Candidatus Saccharibacteria bacterium]|nr:1,4-alpha-glucan-branching enzyme [Candidatus Saccharibacteria bacterium]NCU40227.1 1,4-alpha-glucan-branching enzyme [Candidatus Saccharibacteria bacterium]
MERMNKTLVDLDPWLEPYESIIIQRQKYMTGKRQQTLGKKSASEFALGYLHYGLHRTTDGWVFREWAPHASQIFLVGEVNNWQDDKLYEMIRQPMGNWELTLPDSALKHGQRYKLHIHWPGGQGFRIPSYATRVTQDETTKGFDAVVWNPPKSYIWKNLSPNITEPPMIYEAHVGMSSESPQVATYRYFEKNILPRIKSDGYNTVQLMAIQEHPYYASFGYHVSNFFAASSRYGTPDELKSLIDTAHGMNLRVILDIVHSHSVKNEEEGLGRFDGTLEQYFYPGERGNHELWDSRVFDYGKNQIQHFLLSNLRYWLEEYHVDGFRFDGVTSMIYTHHGLSKDFIGYNDYYNDDVDTDALSYLATANELVHEFHPSAITIAEEMSGFPGVAGPLDHGGLGFDYRMSMGVPDLWVKTLKEKKDEDWDLTHLFHELTARRPEETVISYAESHDQALVGDQTILFRLLKHDIYYHMTASDRHDKVERGIALHKLIRLVTASLNGGGYLNFMGNEFGHPEWIDFPRQGNDWSFHYARRQWSLAENPKLKYHWLGAFDKAMIDVIKHLTSAPEYVHIHNDDHVLSYMRDGFLFAYNFSPNRSYENYQLPSLSGSYQLVISSDDKDFGGQNRVISNAPYLTQSSGRLGTKLSLYLPARVAVVMKHNS